MPEEKAILGSVRFGRFELSADTGELRKDGVRLKLSGQAIQVLAMLAANSGRLVTREELQQKLWPGASYGDPEHGLNAAVNKLRETLGDSASDPKYIETVPGRGYRFIATLESEGFAPALEPPKPPWWKRKATIAATVCLVIVGLLYPLITPRIERMWRLYELQQLKVIPLTTLPGVVWSPTFSPDGSQIAFAWVNGNANSADLYVKVIGNDVPLRLTHEPFGLDWAAWSPDDKNLALCRQADAESFAVFLIPPLGGPERRMSPTNCASNQGNNLSWSTDGKHLAYLEHPSDAQSEITLRLLVLDVDSQEVAAVPTDCNLIMAPAFAPRGDYLAWACADNMSDVSIYIQRLRDSIVSRLARGVDGIGGLAWSGDGRRIIFSTHFDGGDLWEIALDYPNHPYKLPFGHDVTDITVSPKGKRLAFTQRHMNANIWRVDLSQPGSQAQKVVASSRMQTAPNYSPDGTQIAFSSDRSGSNEVWVSDADGSNAVQLSSFGVMITGTPRWSPDGKLIAFDSRVGGEGNIYIVDPRGGIPRKLEIDKRGNSNPSWSNDGAWIYFVNGADTRNPRIWKVPSQGGHAVQIAQHESFYPQESPDGRYVYFSREHQLWRVRADGSEEAQIQGMPGLGAQGEAWSLFGSGIYFLHCGDKAEIDFFDLNTKQTHRIHVLERFPLNWMGGLPVSSDGKWLLFTQVDEQSSDLMLVENWH